MLAPWRTVPQGLWPGSGGGACAGAGSGRCSPKMSLSKRGFAGRRWVASRPTSSPRRMVALKSPARWPGHQTLSDTWVSSATNLPLAAPLLMSMLTLPSASRRAAPFGAQIVEALDAGLGAGAAGFHAFADPHFFLGQQFVCARVDDGLVRPTALLFAASRPAVAGVGQQLAAVELDDAGGHVVQECSGRG